MIAEFLQSVVVDKSECDAKVQSELCVPILDLTHGLPPNPSQASASAAPDSFIVSRTDSSVSDNVISTANEVTVRGIVDAESFQAGYFTPEVVARVTRLCYELSFLY